MAPDSLASERPIAIACFRFVTLCPEPLFSFPCLNAFISRSTLFDALGLYFLVLDFFLLEDFLAADFVRLLELDFLIAMDVFPLELKLEAANSLQVVGTPRLQSFNDRG